MAGALQHLRLDRSERAAARPAVRPLTPFLPVIGFVLAFALIPTAVLFIAGWTAAGGAPGFWAIVTSPLAVTAFDNSLVQGAVSAVVAVGVGYPMGVLLGRYVWTGRSIVQAVLVVPFILPSLVMVLGVRDVAAWALGPTGASLSAAGGLTGFGLIIAVNVLYNAPLVALLTSVGVESASPVLEETVATLGGSPAEAYRRVWGPPSWVGAAAGGLLTFIFSALAFAAPLLLCGANCYTVEVWIWALAEELASPTAAAVMALALALLLILPTLVYLMLWARLRAARGRLDAPARGIPWRSPSTWPLIVAAAAFLGAVVLLLGAVLWVSVAPTATSPAWGSGWSELFGPGVTEVLGISTAGALANSLFFGAVAAGIALFLGLLVGFGRGPTGARTRSLQALLLLPLVISPIVLAFALASTWRSVLGGEATVWVLIIVSQATLALPFALQSLNVALARVPRSFRESAQALGARPWTAYVDVELPQARGGLVTAGLFAFAIGLGEFTATFFLATAQFTTLPVEVYRLEELRLDAAANALAGFLVVVSLLVFLAVTLGGRRIEF